MTMGISQGVFVRGFWGDSDPSYPTTTRTKTLRDIRKSLAAEFQPEPLIVYCWGTENFEFLKSLGVEAELVSERPIEDYSNGKTPRDAINPKGKGKINYGVSMWRHKLECIRMALRNYGKQVIWLDWDVHQIRPIPSHFWAYLEVGRPIRAALRSYKRPQCPWRPRADRRLVVHGGFIYCRWLALIEQIIEVHSTKFPTYTDETPISWVIDELMGGWRGPNAFFAEGFSPPFYDQRKQAVHPRPENPVFQNRGKR